MLEGRRMFCAGDETFGQPIPERRPDLVAGHRHATADSGSPADIVWINRATTTIGGAADTDQFGARFGAAAPAARAVVDAVILAYEKMIGSFNYGDSTTYALTLQMSSAGFGASASLTGSYNDKPQSGTINMQSGNSTPDGAGNGWFLDSTPNDSSEFLGTITNSFAGDAQAGSPAVNKSDFFTVVAAEMTHCMGLFGNSLPGWAALTHATTTRDTAEGGGVGFLWTFNGPSVNHLLTSNNGGSQGSDFSQGIHSAGPISTTVGGVGYNGAQDQGNAVYERGRRYLINNTFALMFKDAYGYSSVDPSKFGTFYSTLNQTTGQVTVRGGQTGASSADNISITRSGSTITVSVDVGNDVAGTGSLPGAGNLPSFVTQYDISQVSSISIAGSDGNDTITLGADLGVNVSVDGGTGTDTINFQGDAGNNAINLSANAATFGTTNVTALTGLESVAIDGAGGFDALTLTGSAGADTFNLGVGTVSGLVSASYANIESLRVNTGALSDTVNINSPALSVIVDVGADGDVVNINETTPGTSVSLATGVAGLATTNVAVNADATGTATLDIPTSVTLQGLSVASGGSVTGGGDLTATGSLNFSGGSIGGAGQLVLSNTATATANGPSFKTLSRVLRSGTTLSISGGTLQVTAGLSGPVTSLTTAAFIVTGLSLTGGTLDLTNNAAIIDYAGSTPLNTVRTSLLSGYNGGSWTGVGIVSSTAAATPGRAIGYAEASSLFGTFPNTFANTPIDATSIALRYTTSGDANLDGAVDFADLLTLSQNFGAAGPLNWRQGDFNYDGLVNFADLLSLSQNFGGPLNTSTPAAVTPRATPSKTASGKGGRGALVDGIL